MFDFLISRFSDFGPLTVLLTVLGLFCLYLFCLIADEMSDKEE